MGLWFGYVGFDISSNRYGSGAYEQVVIMFSVITVCCAGAQMINIMFEQDVSADFSKRYGKDESIYFSKFYENVVIRIQIGFSFMSMVMLYSYMAGPLHEEGAILSPWLLFPMMAILPIIHMLMKEAAAATGDVVHAR